MIYAQPLPQALGSSGITISFKKSATGESYYRVGITERAIKQFFGGEINELQEGVVFGLNPAGDMRKVADIRIDDLKEPNTLTVKSGMKGSLYFKAACWRQPEPPESQKATELKVIKQNDGLVRVELPPWARLQMVAPNKA
ncbi:hypothetical protein [uncultured Pelagimonas sp.]|uniref:hypothetical protein n=1 Tax=uncultured Pelagimonas sp. TaxID=1618102 RepID=UPI002635A88D|nr:hypothetical protein [uncultured Pelagimonas sp.]